ncbi:hypothetical protein SEVIR_1G282901v4 [Setaria viridis]
MISRRWPASRPPRPRPGPGPRRRRRPRASGGARRRRDARTASLEGGTGGGGRKISQKFGNGKRICRNQECLIYTINIKLPFRVINAHVMDLWCQMGKTTSIELVYGEST